MMRKAEWEKLQEDNEWQFVGEGNDFLLFEAQERINNFFLGERIYFVLDRRRSREIARASAAKEIRENLNNNAITLCQIDFKRFMLFHHIGVLRQGVFNS